MPRANRLLAFPSHGPVNIEEALMRRVEEYVVLFCVCIVWYGWVDGHVIDRSTNPTYTRSTYPLPHPPVHPPPQPAASPASGRRRSRSSICTGLGTIPAPHRCVFRVGLRPWLCLAWLGRSEFVGPCMQPLHHHRLPSSTPYHHPSIRVHTQTPTHTLSPTITHVHAHP